MELFSEKWPEAQIVEADAGQKLIDEVQRKKKNEEKLQRLQVLKEQKEEALKYKDLGRNDKCVCGSNLKYKHCCLKRIASYPI